MSPEHFVRVSYDLRQRFRYVYPGPIRNLHHQLVIAPPRVYGDQRCVSDRLTVSPDIPVRWYRDAFDNAVATIDAAFIRDAVEIDYEAVIERSAARTPLIPAAWYDDPRFRSPSALTVPDRRLRDAAAELATTMAQRAGPGDDRRALSAADPRATAAAICEFVYGHMRYASDVTTVETTAAEAFAQGAGVCQDYAHVMIALCRLRGLAARYVSGHMLGEGGTHAWVEIVGPPDGDTAPVWGFDPTHRRATTLRYLFVAAGRDYADVTPTSGRFVAPYHGEFSTSRSVDVMTAEYAA
ncbi:MAG TPA: transglutaminase family protein [Candidatus Elarobacter sp.]|nr:transglutaminase family protein [Candidatus Elarobacter sp.]